MANTPDSGSRPTRRLWNAIASTVLERRATVLVAIVVVTAITALGLTRLDFATGQDSYLNRDDQVRIDNTEYQELFGGQAVLVLFTMDEGSNIGDLMTTANRVEMDRIAQELASHDDLIDNVVTPATALEWTSNLLTLQPDGQPAAQPTASVAGAALLNAAMNDPSEDGRAARIADAAQSTVRLAAVQPERRNLDNHDWVDLLLHDNTGEIRKALRPIFPDEHHARMVVRLVGNASIEQEGDGSKLVRDMVTSSVAAGSFAPSDVTVTGASFLLTDINDYLKSGMIQLGALALAAMAVILLILFRVPWRLTALGVILIGVTWAFGLTGYLGIPLTLVTIAGLPVLLGIGIDFAIQMHARLVEEASAPPEASPTTDDDPATSTPAHRTLLGLGPALVLATANAIFAFVALQFARVPMVRQFGLLLAIGMAVICIASILIPPAVLGSRVRTNGTDPTQDNRDGDHSAGRGANAGSTRENRDSYDGGSLGRLTSRLASLPAKSAPILLIMCVVVLVGGMAVEGKLKMQSDPVEWVDQSSRSITDYHTVERETGSSSELGIFIRTDPEALFTQKTVDFVSDLSRSLIDAYGDPAKVPEGHISPDLVSASSLVTTVDYVIDVPGASVVNPRAADVEAAYNVAPEAIRRSTVDVAAGAQNLIFSYGDRSLEERRATIDGIRDTVSPPEGISATPSGLAVVGVGLLENLEANRALLTYLSILFVGVCTAIVLRSAVRAVLVLIPAMLAVGATSLIAYALDLRLSPMTAVGGPLVVAVCAEFTSLMLLRYLEQRRFGMSPEMAVTTTAVRTGRAFIVSGLTAITGVAVIATSPLPLLGDFGRVVAMNVAVALVAALVVLPPLLIWADHRGWVYRDDGSDRTAETPAA